MTTKQPRKSSLLRWWRPATWALAGIAFIAGPIIGLNVDAEVGAGVWVASAILALIPFASHRNKDTLWR